MTTSRSNAGFKVLFLAVLVGLIAAAGAFAAVKPKPGEVPILDGDSYYCPAEFHTCSTHGTSPYFPPDPFDYGSACDHDFLSWNAYVQEPSPSSCYGGCDANNPTSGCYVGCQDGYSSCLRTAFSLGPRRVSLTSQSPHNTPNVAGNIYRSCLAGTVPPVFAAQYQQCLADGKTVQECCAEFAGNFP
jgi:hypothetical protein